jgi:hypothetical protein
MRIIGGRDYYDSAMAMGQDMTTIFVRPQSSLIGDADLKALGVSLLIPSVGLCAADQGEKRGENWLGMSSFGRVKTRLQVRSVLYAIDSAVVVVAGRLYRGVMIDAYPQILGRADSDNVSRGRVFFWDADSLEAWCKPLGLKVVYSRADTSSAGSDVYFKVPEVSKAAHASLVGYRITVLTLQPLSSYDAWNSERVWNINGANLKDFQFWKKLGAYEVFQEIAMYVAGVLPTMGNPIAEITDNNVKIHKAGFDLKTSFRRGPASRT